MSYFSKLIRFYLFLFLVHDKMHIFNLTELFSGGQKIKKTHIHSLKFASSLITQKIKATKRIVIEIEQKFHTIKAKHLIYALVISRIKHITNTKPKNKYKQSENSVPQGDTSINTA